jgi:hypothetical protein
MRHKGGRIASQTSGTFWQYVVFPCRKQIRSTSSQCALLDPVSGKKAKKSRAEPRASRYCPLSRSFISIYYFHSLLDCVLIGFLFFIHSLTHSLHSLTHSLVLYWTVLSCLCAECRVLCCVVLCCAD